MRLPEAQRLAVHDRLLEELRRQVFGEGCDILRAEKRIDVVDVVASFRPRIASTDSKPFA